MQRLLAQQSPPPAVDNLEAVFGNVVAPQGVQQYNIAAGGIGILLFLSAILRVFTIAMGIFAMINFLLAGYDYINAMGNTQAHTKVKDRLTMTVIGLVLIVGSYTIAGIIGLVFFGNAAFILNPELVGPNSLPVPSGGS